MALPRWRCPAQAASAPRRAAPRPPFCRYPHPSNIYNVGCCASPPLPADHGRWCSYGEAKMEFHDCSFIDNEASTDAAAAMISREAHFYGTTYVPP